MHIKKLLLLLILFSTANWAENFILHSGTCIQGTVIKETEFSIFIDLGYTVFELPKKEIAQRIEEEKSTTLQTNETVSEQGLYTEKEFPASSIQKLVQEHGSGVVKIMSPGGLGSGWIIHPDGYVITNQHVITGERLLSVTVYEKGEKGLVTEKFDQIKIIAMNPGFDLALLKIEPPKPRKFAYVYLAPYDLLKEGDTVFAIGAPLGLDRSVSQGIVSNRSRNVDDKLYIQTTTAINPGNSGGPLFNLKGQVIGVTNMKMGGFMIEGLGYAIPVRYVKEFLLHRDSYAFDKQSP
ncbi:MAG: trypsin-like peptidase domain-containing protein, partial [Planctomycetota bacterium]